MLGCLFPPSSIDLSPDFPGHRLPQLNTMLCHRWPFHVECIHPQSAVYLGSHPHPFVAGKLPYFLWAAVSASEQPVGFLLEAPHKFSDTTRQAYIHTYVSAYGPTQHMCVHTYMQTYRPTQLHTQYTSAATKNLKCIKHRTIADSTVTTKPRLLTPQWHIVLQFIVHSKSYTDSVGSLTAMGS